MDGGGISKRRLEAWCLLMEGLYRQSMHQLRLRCDLDVPEQPFLTD